MCSWGVVHGVDALEFHRGVPSLNSWGTVTFCQSKILLSGVGVG